MAEDRLQIVAAAQHEAAKMKAAIENADDDAEVSMRVRQFSALARLIEALCASVAEPAAGELGEPRYWVPLDEFRKIKLAHRQLEADIQSLRSSLAGQDISFQLAANPPSPSRNLHS